MNQVFRFVSLVSAMLSAFWTHFSGKITALSTTLTAAIAKAKGEAISAAATDATSKASTAKTEAIADAATAATAADVILLADAKTFANAKAGAAQTSAQGFATDADAVVLEAAEDYTDAAIKLVNTAMDTLTSTIQAVQLAAAAGLQAILTTMSSNTPSTVLAEIEGSIPVVSGDKVDGKYSIFPVLAAGSDEVTFTRGGTSYTVSNGDIVLMTVEGGAITSFAISHDNDNSRIGVLETEKADTIYVDNKIEGLQVQIKEFDDKFITALDAVDTALSDTEFSAIWAAVKASV